MSLARKLKTRVKWKLAKSFARIRYTELLEYLTGQVEELGLSTTFAGNFDQGPPWNEKDTIRVPFVIGQNEDQTSNLKYGSLAGFLYSLNGGVPLNGVIDRETISFRTTPGMIPTLPGAGAFSFGRIPNEDPRSEVLSYSGKLEPGPEQHRYSGTFYTELDLDPDTFPRKGTFNLVPVIEVFQNIPENEAERIERFGKYHAMQADKLRDSLLGRGSKD